MILHEILFETDISSTIYYGLNLMSDFIKTIFFLNITIVTTLFTILYYQIYELHINYYNVTYYLKPNCYYNLINCSVNENILVITIGYLPLLHILL